jgi:ubiquinone/menaquinone biosynthesis C-methylase UbiE
MLPIDQIQRDFDRIAALSEHHGETGGTYDNFLLRFVPVESARALEVGCGTGTFTRLLAGRANHVTAIDLSSEMIRIARRRSRGCANIDYSVGNVLEIDLPISWFDCIVMIATLHHMPNKPALEKLKQALKPGGVLILHDLLHQEGIIDRTADLLVRMPTSVALRFLSTGRLVPKREVRRAWAKHCKEERYLTRREVEAIRNECLPGGFVKYHLLWRYSIIWSNPGAGH